MKNLYFFRPWVNPLPPWSSSSKTLSYSIPSLTTHSYSLYNSKFWVYVPSTSIHIPSPPISIYAAYNSIQTLYFNSFQPLSNNTIQWYFPYKPYNFLSIQFSINPNSPIQTPVLVYYNKLVFYSANARFE